MSEAIAECRRPPALRLTLEDVERASDEWGMNCGPAALCAILGKTPDELRPDLMGFDRGHMNAKAVSATLRELGVEFRLKNADRIRRPDWPSFGLARIQWGGTWMGPEVPMMARYQFTHWVASYVAAERVRMVFDVNAMLLGYGWLTLDAWSRHIVPELIAELPPRRDGTWSVSTAVEIL